MGSKMDRLAKLPIALAAMVALSLAVLAAVSAGTADASNYKMLMCAGGVGSGEYSTEGNTGIFSNGGGGIFDVEDHCGPAPDPAGNAAFLRIVEKEEEGNAGAGAFERANWSAPIGVQIAAAGGYTREPNAFNEGWRARYWLEGYDGSVNNVLLQGSGITEPTTITKPKTITFAPHLWPFSTYGSYRRFSFELLCVREAGCDRKDYNAADSNTMLLTLADPSPPTIAISEGALASGRWVTGDQPLSWSTSEVGSGIRYERLRVDGGERYLADYRSSCDLGTTEASGEFARTFQPCPRGGPFPHTSTVATATLSDGLHAAAVCAQDLGQASGVGGTGGESCVTRTIATDNTAPQAPIGLAIGTPNPARYLPSVSASWALAADPGSPIAKVHYWITDATGNVVVPEKVVAATNPTGLATVEGPATPGDYRLDVALEDEVGFVGPAATVAIPHDTIPPAAPQDISVTPPGEARSARGFDVEWQNVLDAGSPITAAHYEILDSGGKVVVGPKTALGANPQAISHLATPRGAGSYRLALWLSDAEGNVGAPVSAPLAFDCVRSDVKGAVSVSATFGADHRNQLLVPFGSGSILSGRLLGAGGRELAGAPVCVFSRVVTKAKRLFLGVAVTDVHGGYAYPVGPGASRELLVENRPGQRTVRSRATLVTRARPTLRLVSKTPVHNKTTAVFRGHLPGPQNDSVAIYLQVKEGDGWEVFSETTTSTSGSFTIRYPFRRSPTPVTYTMRAVMPPDKGVPYHSGSSKLIDVPVRP